MWRDVRTHNVPPGGPWGRPAGARSAHRSSDVYNLTPLKVLCTLRQRSGKTGLWVSAASPIQPGAEPADRAEKERRALIWKNTEQLCLEMVRNKYKSHWETKTESVVVALAVLWQAAFLQEWQEDELQMTQWISISTSTLDTNLSGRNLSPN